MSQEYNNSNSFQRSIDQNSTVIGYDKVTFAAATTVFGSWITLLVIGSQIAWGNMSTYIASYYYNQGMDVSMNQFYMGQPLIVVMAIFLYPIGVDTARRYGAKKILALGGFLQVSLIYVASYYQGPMGFIVLYSLAGGLGKGLMYSAALKMGWSHLPGRKGVVSGLIICGFGFGGFLFGLLSQMMVNPNDQQAQGYMIDGQEQFFFAKEVSDNVPRMLQNLCIIQACMITFTCLISSEYKQPQNNSSDIEQGSTADSDTNWTLFNPNLPEKIAEENARVSDIIKTNKFIVLYLIVMFHMFFGYYISNSYKQYGYEGKLSDETLTWIGSIAALFTGFTKIFWASMLDRFAFKPIYFIIIGIHVVVLTWIHWANQYAIQYLIVICLSFDGSMAAIVPVVTLNIFGTKRGDQVYGVMFSAFGVAAILGLFAVQFFQNSLGYQGMLIICAVFTTIAAILAVFYDFSKFHYTSIYTAQNRKIDSRLLSVDIETDSNKSDDIFIKQVTPKTIADKL